MLPMKETLFKNKKHYRVDTMIAMGWACAMHYASPEIMGAGGFFD